MGGRIRRLPLRVWCIRRVYYVQYELSRSGDVVSQPIKPRNLKTLGAGKKTGVLTPRPPINTRAYCCIVHAALHKTCFIPIRTLHRTGRYSFRRASIQVGGLT